MSKIPRIYFKASINIFVIISLLISGIAISRTAEKTNEGYLSWADAETMIGQGSGVLLYVQKEVTEYIMDAISVSIKDLGCSECLYNRLEGKQAIIYSKDIEISKTASDVLYEMGIDSHCMDPHTHFNPNMVYPPPEDPRGCANKNPPTCTAPDSYCCCDPQETYCVQYYCNSNGQWVAWLICSDTCSGQHGQGSRCRSNTGYDLLSIDGIDPNPN